MYEDLETALKLMDEREAIRRLKDHFAVHDDGRPTPLLDRAVVIAYNALEKRIPKKVKVREWLPAECPSCGTELSEDLGDGYYEHYKYLEVCPNPECCQRLDWGD